MGQPTNNDDMAISEAELRSMTADMADAQHDHLPMMHEGVAAWTEVESLDVRRAMSRRGFMASAGALIAGGVVLATLPAAAATLRPNANLVLPESTKGVPLDVVVAGLAASLENLAVATYSGALTAAGAGKLGPVPPAVATFAKEARAQHAQHAAAWNSILTAAHYQKITAVNPVYAKIVNEKFAKVKNVTGVAELALTLEGVAAATYLEAIKAVSTKSAIEVAASIQPVEMQHVAILNFVLGKYPVPDAFASATAAAPVSSANGLTFKKT
jgi:Ferritin-like domain